MHEISADVLWHSLHKFAEQMRNAINYEFITLF